MAKKGTVKKETAKEAVSFDVVFNTEQRLNFSSKLARDEIQLILPAEFAEFFTQSNTGQVNETARQLIYNILSTIKRIRSNYIAKANKGLRNNPNPYVSVGTCEECGYELFVPKIMLTQEVEEKIEETNEEPVEVVEPVVEEPVADEGDPAKE